MRTPRGGASGDASAPASPAQAAALAAAAAADGDAAGLQAECARLAKELADAKRKFVAVAKKKQADFAAR